MLATQSQKTAHARKDEMLHGKIISSYLIWAKVFIIIVNFGNKTLDKTLEFFGENCGWQLLL